MEWAARLMNGNRNGECTVPGCTEDADHLDHRKAWTNNGGRTCVSNLFPMCSAHNTSKGEKDYDEWLLAMLVDDLVDQLL
jgi:hypothetical protein